MNGGALRACIRREVQRGARSLTIFSAIALAAVISALVLPTEFALIPAIVGMLFGVLALFAPSADLANDRLHGHFEFDRALPLPPRLIAAGRLLGAALRTLPFGFCVLAFVLGLVRVTGNDGSLSTAAAVMIAGAATVAGWMGSWILLAINSRWALRRIWWLGPTLALAPQILPMMLPASAREWVVVHVTVVAEQLRGILARPAGLIGVMVVLATLPVLVFSSSTLLFATGIRRYQFDPTAMHLGFGGLPREELSAIGRGPVAAVARLRLRLALEQFRRELLVILVLLLAVLFGSEALRIFSRSYIRIIAALLPSGVAIQVGQARAKGYLESLQQLPHAHHLVALGHLAAIAALAIPGAGVLLVAQGMSGERITVASGLQLWAWFVTIAWVSCALSVWLKKRHLAAFALLLLAGMFAVVLEVVTADAPDVIDLMVSAWHAFGLFSERVGPVFPLGVMGAAILIGIPLFSAGLRNYQYQGP